MQFLSENHLNGYQIFWTVWFLRTESKPNFGFPHIPSDMLSNNCRLGFKTLLICFDCLCCQAASAEACIYVNKPALSVVENKSSQSGSYNDALWFV